MSRIRIAMEEAINARNAAADALLHVALGNGRLQVDTAYVDLHLDPHIEDTPLKVAFDTVLTDEVPEEMLKHLRKLP